MGLLDSLRRALAHPSPNRHGDVSGALRRELLQLYDGGLYREAAVSARRLADIQKHALGERHPDYAATLGTLGLLLQRHGDLAGAEPLQRLALEVTREALGEHHPDYATGLNNLAELLHLRGDLAGAETLLRRSLAICREARGERHQDYATGLSSLASLLQRRGDLAGAETLLREVLEIRREVLGERHPSYATGLNNLALVLQQRGDLAGAEPLLRQALTARGEVLTEEHPDFARSLDSLAALLWTRGELDEALPLYQQALAIFRKVLGERHPDYATSLNNLALLLRDRRDWSGAEPLLRQALEVRREVLGERHPDTIASAEGLESVARLAEAGRARAGDLDAAAVGRATTEEPPGLLPIPPDDGEKWLDHGPPESVDAHAMAGSPESRALSAELAALTSRMVSVGGRLAQEARRMQDTGRPPDIAILEAAVGSRREFDRLRAEILRLASSLAVIPPGPVPSPDTARDLAALLREAALAEDATTRDAEVRRLASEALGRVMRLVDAGGGSNSALTDCQAGAGLLLRTIAGRPFPEPLPPDAEALAGGRHVLSALLTLVEPGGELAEDDWAVLLETVREAFGRTLAVSVARGRVVLGPEFRPGETASATLPDLGSAFPDLPAEPGR